MAYKYFWVRELIDSLEITSIKEILLVVSRIMLDAKRPNLLVKTVKTSRRQVKGK